MGRLERHKVMRSFFSLRIGARTAGLLVATFIALGCGSSGKADSITLDFSNAKGADVSFAGNSTGTGATFVFNNNGSGEGFQITGSSGVGNSVGLFGTLGGSYSYTTASIVTMGILQTAPVTTSGGSITITDNSDVSLTATVAGIDVTTIGAGGVVNVGGVINLTGVSYSGTNADLQELRNDAAGGGIVSISFQFVSLPIPNLTSLAAMNAEHSTSYSGTIVASAVPEPSSFALACIAAVTLIGCGLRRSRA